MSNLITAERLREVLHYDAETGLFRWRAGVKVSSRYTRRSEKVVGHKHQDPRSRSGLGYIQIWLDGRLYPAHRLAWLYVYGTWPLNQIDHIDGDTQHNAICNLRECDHEQNQQNRTAGPQGTTGVSLCRSTGRWRAKIWVSRKQTHLGYFDTPEQAHQAYLKAKRELHTFQPTPRATRKTT